MCIYIMLRNKGLTQFKCMNFFIIPIVKSNTPLFLDIKLVGKHYIKAFATQHQVAEL